MHGLGLPQDPQLVREQLIPCLHVQLLLSQFILKQLIDGIQGKQSLSLLATFSCCDRPQTNSYIPGGWQNYRCSARSVLQRMASSFGS